MTQKHLWSSALALTLIACHSGGPGTNDANDVVNAAVNGDLINSQIPTETKTVDATSPMAARSRLTDYSTLAAKRDFARAADYWIKPDNAAQFAADLEDYPKVAMSIGEPAPAETAAGAFFITIPVELNLTLRSGAPYVMSCKATLRRSKPLPGATPKDLQWNIQAIVC